MPENIFRADKVNDILVELCNDVADHGGVDLARYRDRLGEAVTAVTAERLPKWDDLEQAMLAVAERVWDQTYEGDEDGGAGDLQAVVAALVTEFGFPLGAGLDTIHRPDSDEPRYTGWQWIRRCIVDGDKWPCATAEANGIENDAVAWHWNQVESAERAAEVGDERQLDYLKRMVAGQAGKAQRRGRTLTVLRDYVATCTSLGREPQAAALLAMLNENERVLGVIENSMHPIAEPLNSAQLAEVLTRTERIATES